MIVGFAIVVSLLLAGVLYYLLAPTPGWGGLHVMLATDPTTGQKVWQYRTLTGKVGNVTEATTIAGPTVSA